MEYYEDEKSEKDEDGGAEENAEELSEVYERQSRRYVRNLDVREEVK